MTYSFQPKTPLDFLLPIENQDSKDYTYSLNPAARGFLQTLAMHRDSACWSIMKAQDEQSLQFNKGRQPVPDFKQGDRVLVNLHSLDWIDSKGTRAKLKQRWIGPFEIQQKINLKVFRLRMSDKYPGFPVFNFNINHLKKYKESSPEMGDCTTMAESRRAQEETQEYEVKSIVGHHRSGRSLQYLVHWLGYGPQHDTWESAQALRNAVTLVCRYHEFHNLWLGNHIEACSMPTSKLTLCGIFSINWVPSWFLSIHFFYWWCFLSILIYNFFYFSFPLTTLLISLPHCWAHKDEDFLSKQFIRIFFFAYGFPSAKKGSWTFFPWTTVAPFQPSTSGTSRTTSGSAWTCPVKPSPQKLLHHTTSQCSDWRVLQGCYSRWNGPWTLTGLTQMPVGAHICQNPLRTLMNGSFTLSMAHQ